MLHDMNITCIYTLFVGTLFEAPLLWRGVTLCCVEFSTDSLWFKL